MDEEAINVRGVVVTPTGNFLESMMGEREKGAYTPTGVDLITRAKEAGFNDDEIGATVAQLRKEASDAGFGQGEIDTFFGQPPFDATPIKKLVDDNIKQATKPEGADGQPKPVNSFMDALEFGLQSSVSGLLVRGKTPDKQMTEDAPMASRVVAGMATMAGDLPFMAGGALAGGANPITGTAGAFALPAGMRKILMDKYENGEATTFGEFWERASGAIIETGKAWVTGAAVGKVGQLVKGAEIASPTARAAATVTADVATMVSVGAALNLEIPKMRDFADAAVVIFGVKAGIKGAAKLRKIYAEKGVKPADLVADMEKDPTILQEVLSDNVEVPGAYGKPAAVKPKDTLATTDLPEYAQGAIMSEQRARQTNDGVDAHLADAEWKHVRIDLMTLYGKNKMLFHGEQFTHRGSMTEGPIVLDRDGTILDGNNRVYEALNRGETKIEAYRPVKPEEAADGGGQEPPKPPTPPEFKGNFKVEPNYIAKHVSVLSTNEIRSYGETLPAGVVKEENGIHYVLSTVSGQIEVNALKHTKDGYITVGKLDFQKEQGELVPANIAVTPELQRQGIASTMLQVAKDQTKRPVRFDKVKEGIITDEGAAVLNKFNAGGGKEPPKPPTPPAAKEPDNPLYAKHIEKDKTPEEEVLSRLSIGGKDPKEKWSWSRFYTKVVDDLHPIQEAVKAMAQGKSIETAKHAYQLARLSRGAFGKANQMLEYATYDFKTYENNGKSLKQILKPVNKDLNGFRAYAAAKRAMELADRGIETGIDGESAKAVVKGGREKYEPIMRELVDFQNRVSKHLLDSGIITKEVYDAMLDANKEFVPFYRVMDEGLPGGSKIGGGMTVKNPIKGIEGSEREIVDPLESIIKNTYAYTALADRNVAMQAFVNLALQTKNPGDFIRKVAPAVREVKLHEEEIQALFDEFLTVKKKTTTERSNSSTTTKTDGAAPDSKAFTMVKDRVMEALKARGFSDGEASQMVNRLMAKDASSSTTTTIVKEIQKTEYVPEIDIRLPNDVASVFRTVREPLKDNEIGFFQNGKWSVFEVDKAVAQAFKALDAESANFLVKILAIPARTLRAGAVLSPDFMGRNILRDQTMAFALSKSGYLPFIDLVRGFLSIVKKDDHFQNWLKSGGAQSTFAAMDRQYMKDSLEALTKNTGLGSRAWNVVKSPLDLLRAISELAENSTRLGVFKQSMKHGVNDKASLQEAAMVAREGTLDFQRIGSKMRAANMIATFLNAHVQGLDRVARGFKDDPFGMTMRAGISITVPSMLLWMANKDDERYREIPRWEKDLFWHILTKDTIYRIPKPHELGLIFGSVPERLLENFLTDNPDAAKDIEKSLIQAFIPNMIPTAVTPMIEQFANRSLFTGSPIIPAELEKQLPEYQYTSYTTETSKALGRILGSFPGFTKRAASDDEPLIGGVARSIASPILMENYLRAWTGGLGMYVLQLADKGLREAHVVPDPVKPASTLADIPFVKAFVSRYPSASAQSIQDFHDHFFANKKIRETWEARSKEGDLAAMKKVDALDKSALVKLDGVQKTLTQQGQLVRMIAKNPRYTADEKRQLIDSAYSRMIEVSRFGKTLLRQLDEKMNAQP